MLEACVDRQTGDVIVVKPKGSPWSDTERDGSDLVVIELDDRTKSLQGAVKAYPYAVMGFDADDPDSEIMVEISRWKVDTQGLESGAKFKRADLKENLADYPEREILR
jgi:hypothetical protein